MRPKKYFLSILFNLSFSSEVPPHMFSIIVFLADYQQTEFFMLPKKIQCMMAYIVWQQTPDFIFSATSSVFKDGGASPFFSERFWQIKMLDHSKWLLLQSIPVTAENPGGALPKLTVLCQTPSLCVLEL